MSCEGATVLFPLVSSKSRWRLLFGGSVEANHEALRDIDLCVPEGKIIGVIGRNGAGKSTLLRTLAGVYPLNKGRVVRLGAVSALFELGGMGGLLITGRQYVQRWLRLHDVPRSEWKAFIEDVREFSELGERIEDRIFTYSAGMAARLYFSTATCVGHKIYLIDEVLSVGDEHFQAKCWRRIRERLAGGVSGVLVTHDWSAILRLCESACEIEGGEIVNRGNAESVICNYLKIANQLSNNREAEFASTCPENFEAVSGEDWVGEIPIEVFAETPVFFNFSIEKLVLGNEWQILLMGTETLIATLPGSYKARVSIPSLPLPGGEYRLCLFLLGEKPSDGGPKPSLDVRSWTSGNSLRLIVDGPEQDALVCFSLSAGTV